MHKNKDFAKILPNFLFNKILHFKFELIKFYFSRFLTIRLIFFILLMHYEIAFLIIQLKIPSNYFIILIDTKKIYFQFFSFN